MRQTTQPYDLIIVGAGPAGLTLAHELAPTKKRILLIDKKKNHADLQYRTSGSFLDLKQWNIPAKTYQNVTHASMSTRNHSYTKPLKKGVVIVREKLLELLEKRATAHKNVTLLYSAPVVGVKKDRDGNVQHITYKKGEQYIHAQAFIYADCSGLAHVIAKHVGLSTSKRKKAVGAETLVTLKKQSTHAEFLYGDPFQGGYGWFFPLPGKKAIVGCGTLIKEKFPTIRRMQKQLLAIPHIHKQCKKIPTKMEIATIDTGKPLKELHKGNVLILGDSALHANPFAGEGVRFCMESARICANTVKQALEEQDLKRLKDYTRTWKKTYAKQYRLSYLGQRLIDRCSRRPQAIEWLVRRSERLSVEEITDLIAAKFTWRFYLLLLWRFLFKKSRLA